MADGLGRFVAGNFLEPTVLSARLTELDLSGALARWLSRKPVSDALAERLASGLPVILSAIEDQDVRKFVGDALAIKAAQADGFAYAVRLDRKADVPRVVAEFLAFNGPAFLEVMIDPDAGVYPMVGPGQSYEGMITGPHIPTRRAAPVKRPDASEMF